MPEQAPEQSTGNDAMRRYWNEVAGPRWISRAETQEARNIEVAEMLLAEIAAKPGERVLDVGCGPGATALPLAGAVAPGGSVVGIDISEPMLGLLRQRIAERGIGNLEALLADAQTHALPSASFDLLTSRFGVMFFADPTAAFRNLHGALRPGGRLVMAVWSTITDNTHWKIPFDIAVARVGEPAPTPPEAPGPMAFQNPDYLRNILDRAGFADVAIAKRAFHVRGSSAAAEAELAAAMGPASRLLDEKQADAATRQTVVSETERAYAPYTTATGECHLPGTFLLVTARKP